jgi:hypothetical protein
VIAAAIAAVCLLAAGVLSGLVFAPSRRTRTPVEELRELAEFRFRVGDPHDVAHRALSALAGSRAANLRSRSRILRSMLLYVTALGVLGSQVLLIAAVHLLGL